MFSGVYQRHTTRQCRYRSYLLLALLGAFTTSINAQQENVTVDDVNLFITYSPAKSWHASTVPCDGCLMPLNQTALNGTWHDGTHIVGTIDPDDLGNSSSTSASSSSTSQSSTAVSTSLASSSSIAPPQSTNTADPDAKGNDDDDNDDDDGKKGKGGNKKRFKRTRRSSTLDGRAVNPFVTTGPDSDDADFHDDLVTATFNFNGTAIYVFGIIPLFPAPANTTPTATNLTFTFDNEPQGRFLHLPDATIAGTPTVNSSTADKFLPNVTVFSARDLADTNHTLVVTIGDDSVFLFDYAIYTIGKSDTVLGESTENIASSDDTQHKHDVATFAGAVGGSVGFLSVLALGLCISIRMRRRRARLRERSHHQPFAEVFTAHDHGNMDEPPPAPMSQARPGPFVPRYFPGSVPASPPPYVAHPNAPPYPTTTLAESLDRAGLPVSNPHAPPLNITMPMPSLLANRAHSISSSYADRPPPTPSSEEAVMIFGTDSTEEDRRNSGGIVGPLPIDSPVAEESDPMLNSMDFHSSREGWSPDEASNTMSERRRSSTSLQSQSFDSHTDQQPTPSLARSSLTGSSTTHEELATPKRTSHLPPGLYPTLSTSTSLPSLYHPRPQRFISPSHPDLFASPSRDGENSTKVTYPILQPNRVPLPASIYESDLDSLQSLSRHESRS